VFMEQRMAEVDFTLLPLGPRMTGARFLVHVLQGDAVDWNTCNVPPGKVDHVLAALGLYHMRVRCVIPEELDGDYECEVSALREWGPVFPCAHAC
jgi:hypothetical protein